MLKNSIFIEKDIKVEFSRKFNKEINLKKKINPESKNWKLFSDKCLNCGACTMVCPTCGCFDVKDKLELNLDEGKRVRVWDSCQLKDFTKVAGGHVFRDTREARLKHFVLHKLKYFKDKFDMHLCIGCGRCITACPARIDITEVVDKI